jgi:hypothetical protein
MTVPRGGAAWAPLVDQIAGSSITPATPAADRVARDSTMDLASGQLLSSTAQMIYRQSNLTPAVALAFGRKIKFADV